MASAAPLGVAIAMGRVVTGLVCAVNAKRRWEGARPEALAAVRNKSLVTLGLDALRGVAFGINEPWTPLCHTCTTYTDIPFVPPLFILGH
jgi:hypothetical protein